MPTNSKWTSPAVAATGLFISGIIFGVGVPTKIPESSLSLVLSSITAFGTLLLGVAATVGVNQWRIQHREVKATERAELAVTKLFSLSTKKNQLEFSVKRLRGHCRLSTPFVDADKLSEYADDILSQQQDFEKNLSEMNHHFSWFSKLIEDDLKGMDEALMSLCFSISPLCNIEEMSDLLEMSAQKTLEEFLGISLENVEKLTLHYNLAVEKLKDAAMLK